MSGPRPVVAPRGNNLTCKGWIQEAALRMLMNNLDPDVAENPDELVVYGGTGKAARNWESFDKIVDCLRNLTDTETLLVQSGKPVAIFPSHKDAPRVLIANSNLVGKWANWDHFHELERKGLMMYGQMTAGSWIYIGTQGILQGTYETFIACGEKYFGGDLRGRFVYSGGLGGMGGAQPLAATIAGGVFLGVDIDATRVQRRIETRYLDVVAKDLDDALRLVDESIKKREARSIGLVGNAADVLAELIKRNRIPDVVTDQTSAHDELNGYIPSGFTVQTAATLRKSDPKEYVRRAYETMAAHVSAMAVCQDKGARVFDYGNNIRAQAEKGGCERSNAFLGFVPEFIRPQFCEGRGPFRWAVLSGEPADIYTIDEALMKAFPDDRKLQKWITMLAKKLLFKASPHASVGLVTAIAPRPA